MLKRIVFILSCILCIILVHAQTDTLLLSSGDEIVGEIKKMDRGVLTIETDYSDSDFKVEWDKVVQMKSDRNFIITLSNGERLFGAMRSNPSDTNEVIIINEGVPLMSKLIDVVYIEPVEKNFISRLDLLISIGYTLTKANNMHQFNMRSNIGYLANSWKAEAGFDAIRSIQDSVSNTSRTDANIGFRYFLPKDWFVLIAADFLQSTELKLDLRANTKLGAGNYVVHTNKVYLGLAAGGAWNYERYSDPEQADRNSLEAFAGVEFNIFDMGDLDLFTNLMAYPGITEAGRFRTDYSFDLKYDFLDDFFINLGFTLNYDNQPIEGASELDYVIQTTLGWEL
jgi:hypothetical protein